jgi:hypothetical protein
LLLSLTVSCCVEAKQNHRQNSEESCQKFVQDFYNWYMSKALKRISSDPLGLALKYKRAAFSPELVRGLEAVRAEQKSDKDVGLGFDPILNSQDPGDPGDSYVAGRVARRDDTYTVELHGVFSRLKMQREPLVLAELKIENGKWVFVNFHYPNSTSEQNENLLVLIKNYLALSSK